MKQANDGIGQYSNITIVKYGVRIIPNTCNEEQTIFSISSSTITKLHQKLQKHIQQYVKEHKISNWGSLNDNIQQHMKQLQKEYKLKTHEFHNAQKPFQNIANGKMLQLMNVRPFDYENVYSFFETQNINPNIDDIERLIDSYEEYIKIGNELNEIQNFVKTIVRFCQQIEEIIEENDFDAIVVKDINGTIDCFKEKWFNPYRDAVKYTSRIDQKIAKFTSSHIVAVFILFGMQTLVTLGSLVLGLIFPFYIKIMEAIKRKFNKI